MGQAMAQPTVRRVQTVPLQQAWQVRRLQVAAQVALLFARRMALQAARLQALPLPASAWVAAPLVMRVPMPVRARPDS